MVYLRITLLLFVCRFIGVWLRVFSINSDGLHSPSLRLFHLDRNCSHKNAHLSHYSHIHRMHSFRDFVLLLQRSNNNPIRLTAPNDNKTKLKVPHSTEYSSSHFTHITKSKPSSTMSSFADRVASQIPSSVRFSPAATTSKPPPTPTSQPSSCPIQQGDREGPAPPHFSKCCTTSTPLNLTATITIVPLV